METPGDVTRSTGGLPSLGSRGGGWVIAQLVVYGVVLVAGRRGRRWSGWPTARAAAGTVLLTVGALMLLAGSAQMGRRSLTPYPRPRASSELVRSGLYSQVRHPIYGGVLALAAGWSLLTGPAAVLATGLTAAFLEMKSHREETWLRQRYPEYEQYRHAVPRRFLPFIW